MYHAFTAKKINMSAKNLKECHYVDWMDICRDRGAIILHYFYEYDENMILHIHGTMELPKGYYIKKLAQNGFHYKLKPISNLPNMVIWFNYITKNQGYHFWKDRAIAHFAEKDITEFNFGPDLP